MRIQGVRLDVVHAGVLDSRPCAATARFDLAPYDFHWPMTCALPASGLYLGPWSATMRYEPTIQPMRTDWSWSYCQMTWFTWRCGPCAVGATPEWNAVVCSVGLY